ncbi:hypothetical protein GCM10022222_85270 [Amycolatopsis ultiminotia]|uniref:Uncharacterized protein n=2 Tax=Amycolatopsis ultiminotia TaxID=543629 RepID=A0ABP6YQD1_9PSEU
MDGVGTSVVGRPRRLSADRRVRPTYTLIWEEPSKNGKFRIVEARDALAMVHTVAEEFAAEVKALCETTVTEQAWRAFLDAHTPVPEEKGRARTTATNERAALNRLWNTDNRVSPWRGTAWGVVQAINTYTHHEAIVRNASRAERNMSRAVDGKADALD